MPVKLVCARQAIKLIDPAEEIIGRHVERISKAAQIVEGRLSGPCLEVRDR